MAVVRAAVESRAVEVDGSAALARGGTGDGRAGGGGGAATGVGTIGGGATGGGAAGGPPAGVATTVPQVAGADAACADTIMVVGAATAAAPASLPRSLT
ncbi:hypothetical protein ACQP04_13800 [Pseudonocardia halophobica]|uniref:hypothetical protein n=1 Tax=Pseudonocardia halophobica TaxID=29401 RepID=UPI003D94D804